MTQIEKETFTERVNAMTEEEQRLMLESIPLQFMLDEIGLRCKQQDVMIKAVRRAMSCGD